MVSCLRCCAYLILTIAILIPLLPLLYSQSDRREFNYRTTESEAINNIDLNNKVIIVTGSNTGIGLPTAKVLLHHGAIVIMACRNMSKAKIARENMLKDITNQDPSEDITKLSEKVEIIHLDLGSFKSIDMFLNKFHKKYDKLNYLILNAGVQKNKFEFSTDGIEQTFQINHLGHFYMAMELTPLLIKTAKSSKEIARIVSVASTIHTFSPKPFINFINEDHIQDPNEFDTFTAYGYSKASNILFAKEYNDKYGNKNDNVYAISLHPGSISTELSREHSALIKFIYDTICNAWFLKTREQGAATQIRLISLTDQEFIKYGGSYFVDCNEANYQLRKDLFQNELAQKKLWKLSEEMIKKYK